MAKSPVKKAAKKPGKSKAAETAAVQTSVAETPIPVKTAVPSAELREVGGFLFIGDPHLSSRRPGRRKDGDYTSTILAKIEFAIDLANKNHLVPVILGDLFDRPKEEDENIKTKLLRLLRKCWTKPIVLVGNHDRRHAVLTDGDTLAVIVESGVIKISTQAGPIEEFLLGPDRIRVGLGGSPHGQDIPKDVRHIFPDAKTVVWLTHHDLAFEGSYPGSMEPFEIVGCPLVINGHMHLTKRQRLLGKTVWFNPGNITRQAIDAIAHVPRVWELKPDGTLQPHDVPHEKDVFDLTGKLVTAVSPGEYPREQDEAESLFVDMLQAEASTEMEKTHDGSVLMEELEAKFRSDGTSPEVREVVLSLLRAVTQHETLARETA